MNCLVTGGAGFIGSHLAEALLAQGHRVVCLDDLSTGSLANIYSLRQNRNFSFFKGSILNPYLLDHIFSQQIDEVYHLAAVVGVQLILSHPTKTIEVNAFGSENIFDACERYGCRIIYSSSSEVYGGGSNRLLEESSPRLYGASNKLRWTYAITKNMSEQSALARFQERHFPVTIARLFNTIGPRQSSAHGMVVPTFIKQACSGAPIVVYGNGEQRRCFSWVGDVCKALIDLARSPHTLGEIYNIGTTEEISIKTLAGIVKERASSLSPIQFTSYEQAYNNNFEEIFYRKPSLEKIRAAIGYVPTLTLTEMIDEILTSELHPALEQV